MIWGGQWSNYLYAGAGNDEIVGGPTVHATNEGLSGSEDMDMLREENPTAFAAGELAGIVPAAAGAAVKAGRAALGGAASTAEKALARGVKALDEWNPVNTLWDWVMSSKAPATGLRGAASQVGKTAAASAATQAVGEGVQAAANYAGTGETGSLREAAGRIGDAAEHGAADL